MSITATLMAQEHSRFIHRVNGLAEHAQDYAHTCTCSVANRVRQAPALKNRLFYVRLGAHWLPQPEHLFLVCLVLVSIRHLSLKPGVLMLISTSGSTTTSLGDPCYLLGYFRAHMHVYSPCSYCRREGMLEQNAHGMKQLSTFLVEKMVQFKAAVVGDAYP